MSIVSRLRNPSQGARQSSWFLHSLLLWCNANSTFVVSYWSTVSSVDNCARFLWRECNSWITMAGEGTTEYSEQPGVRSSVATGEEKWKAWQVDHSGSLCMKPSRDESQHWSWWKAHRSCHVKAMNDGHAVVQRWRGCFYYYFVIFEVPGDYSMCQPFDLRGWCEIYLFEDC